MHIRMQLPALFRVIARALSIASITIVLLSQPVSAQPGTVKSWGLNNAGQLGDGTTTDKPHPTAVAGLTDVVAMGAGNGHTVALLADGTVRSWGFNFFGSLGDGTTITRTT